MKFSILLQNVKEHATLSAGARVENGVEVVTVMEAGTGGGSGVRSDVLFAFGSVGDPKHADGKDTNPR